MQEKLKVFRENHCFTKGEIEHDFENFVKWNYYESDEEITETHKKSMFQLFDGQIVLE